MPDFVAALAAAVLFCVGVLILNALTRLALALHLGPADLAENGLGQYGLAFVLAGMVWMRALSPRSI